MTVRTKLAAAMPFAHLLGIRAEDDEGRKGKRARRAEDDERDDDEARRAEEDEREEEEEDRDGKKGKRARRAEKEDDEGGDDGDEAGKKGKRAEKDEDEGEENEDDEDGKKGKRARRAEEDDDEDEMRGSGSRAAARRRERARCKAIFSVAAAGTHPHVAANLAFNTDMPRAQAIAVLESIAATEPTRRGASLADRMAAAPVPRVGADGGSSVPAGMSKTAAAIVAAAEKAQRR